MMIIRFKSGEEHQDLLHKVKKMEKFASEISDILEECVEDDSMDFRGSYRNKYDDDDMRMEGRYGYRRGGMR